MSEPKLCPFNLSGEVYKSFAPCLQDKCAMWRTSEAMVKHLTSTGVISAEYQFMFYCGLAGKP